MNRIERRKIQKENNILIVLIILLAIMCFYWVFIYINDIKADRNELKEQNKCYQTLYNEDIIGKGCDKYFKQDSWYIEYKNMEN